MLTDVQAALDSILGSVATLQNANGAGRIFELFVMTRVANELRIRGCEVWLQRSDGTRIRAGDSDRRFIQRGGSPKGVPAISKGPNNASTMVFRKGNRGSEWEFWNGIQFQGRSGASHEIDIAIVPRQVGQDLRSTGGQPFGRPRVAIECKDVGTTGSIDETRAFVARLYDLTILQSHQPYIAHPPPAKGIYPGNFVGQPFYSARTSYWDENRHTFNAIARRTGFASGAAYMTSYYAVEPHASITAGSSEADQLVDAVSSWIMSRLP
jgi:hypothetical protein